MAGIHKATQGSPRARTPRRSHPRTRSATEESPPGPPPPSPALQANVLVLNRLYLAIHIVTVRRAFALLFRDLAEVIHLEEGPQKETTFANYDFQAWREVSELRAESKQPHDDWIRAVNFEIQVPRVIRLFSYDRRPKQQLHLTRRTVLARDEHCCQYCGRHLPNHQLSLDHITPRSMGGMSTWENVVCACLKCNVKKGGRTPKQARMKLVRRPVKPRRNPVLTLKLNNPKYHSWRTWLDGARVDFAFRI